MVRIIAIASGEARAVVLESQEQSERAGEPVRDALLHNPGIEGVYNVSAGAPPVVAALKALHREDVVSIADELTPDRRELLRQGLIDAIIDQRTPNSRSTPRSRPWRVSSGASTAPRRTRSRQSTSA